MLLDDHMPEYGWNEIHAIDIDAPPAVVMDAVRAVTAGEIRLLRVLMGLRRLPGRIAGRPRLPRERAASLLAGMRSLGFVFLGEDDGEIVVGTVGRFWKLCPVHAEIAGAPEFAAFTQPGWARAAMNFTVLGMDGGRTRLVTETRIAATDASARRRFGAYWTIVHPGSALIRRMWLRAVKRRAERR